MTGAARTSRRTVRLSGWLYANGRELLAICTNASAGGLHLRVDRCDPEDVQAGARVEVRLSLPGSGEPLAAAAEIVWHRQDPAPSERTRGPVYMGLKFLELTEQAAKRLETFLRDFRHFVVVIDPDLEYAEHYQRLQDDYAVRLCRSADEALEVLRTQPVGALIVSDELPGTDAYAWLSRVSEELPNSTASRIAVSDFTAAAQIRVQVNAGKLFAYLRKPFTPDYLLQIVHRAVEAHALAEENSLLRDELDRANERLLRESAYLRQRFAGREGFEALVGRSRELLKLVDELDRVRRSDATVHIRGETGTGKELVARALHQRGLRATRPFVAQNCAGITEELMLSILFGHKKGAFTGADRDFKGVFQQADGGTVFLDEVAELAPGVQAALLRVLNDGEVVPLGGREPSRVDVRVISATHKNLRAEVKQGRFREDLYFRLAVLTLEVPPLRERTGDVALLAMHFLDLHCELKGKDVRGFTPEAIVAFERYGWPGNIREMENEIERLVVLADDGEKIDLSFLSPHIREAADVAPAQGGAERAAGIIVPGTLSYDAALEHLERELIERALAYCKGNVSRASRMLGMERSRLAKLRDRVGLKDAGRG